MLMRPKNPADAHIYQTPKRLRDVPGGFLIFLVELGVLEPKSPFVGLLQTCKSVLENLYELIDELRKNEVDDYDTAKTAFDNRAVRDIQGPRITLCRVFPSGKRKD
jgi:hypothetical protein